MTTTAQLAADYDRVHDVANEAREATEQIARAANGNSIRVLPAPAVYELLGNVKVILWHLREAAEYLPRGLARSLSDEAIEVYDRDPRTGEPRDAAVQVGIASDELAELVASLAAVGSRWVAQANNAFFGIQAAYDELVPGFEVTSQDTVVDVGCGTGGASLFCARQGATVYFSDVEQEKVDEAFLPITRDERTL